MDGQSGRPAAALAPPAAQLLQQLAQSAQAWELFAALREIERAHPRQPRLGRSARPADDPVRLRQQPTLSFAACDIAQVTAPAEGRPAAVHGHAFGLFGPNGPLPLHLTEHALQRQRSARDDSLVAFADLFHHRLLSLFYRAWADAQPVVQADRADDDRFRQYLGALVGIGLPSLQRRDALDDDFRRHHAGRLQSLVRNAEGLQSLIVAALQVPVQVLDFIVEWMRLPAADQLRLGAPSTMNALGHSAVLGAQVRGCQYRFRLRVGPLSLEVFRQWLPGGQALARLTALVRSYVGDAQVWDVQLLLRADQVPRMRLGRSGRLGLDSWLGQRGWSVVDADDVVVQPPAVSAFSHRTGPMT